MDISFARRIPVLFRNGDTTDKRRLDAYASLLEPLVKPESLAWYESDAPPPVAAVHLVGDMEVLVPMKGLIDQKAELVRLDKEIQKRTNEHDRCEGKVTNPDFVSKAPADVVEKERIKLAELKLALEKLGGQRVRLQEM
jgi:valyl-tRNA synthetase